MAITLSPDAYQKMLEMFADDEPMAAVAAVLGKSLATAHRLRKRWAAGEPSRPKAFPIPRDSYEAADVAVEVLKRKNTRRMSRAALMAAVGVSGGVFQLAMNGLLSYKDITIDYKAGPNRPTIVLAEKHRKSAA
jgi:hypothetical protein